MNDKPPLMKLTGVEFPRLEDAEQGKRKHERGGMTREELRGVKKRDQLAVDLNRAELDRRALIDYIELLHKRLDG